MRMKITEKNTISLLQKGALNFEFLTTKTRYQYFYTEVFQEEKGELILHSKRIYRILCGKIINKSEKIGLSNTFIYPYQSSEDANILNYNDYNLKLNFSYANTSQCKNGCYFIY